MSRMPPRRLYLAVLAAAAACASTQIGTAAAAGVHPAPAALVGSWARTVTQADIRRAGAAFVSPGLWRLRIARTGALDVYNTPGDVPIASGRLRSTATKLTFVRFSDSGGEGCPRSGIYRWRVSDRRLLLTKLKDDCAERVAILVGKWRRR